jgi:hypothetical protein
MPQHCRHGSSNGALPALAGITHDASRTFARGSDGAIVSLSAESAAATCPRRLSCHVTVASLCDN